MRLALIIVYVVVCLGLIASVLLQSVEVQVFQARLPVAPRLSLVKKRAWTTF